MNGTQSPARDVSAPNRPIPRKSRRRRGRPKKSGASAAAAANDLHHARVLREPMVLQWVQVAHSTLWKWIAENRFPAPIRLGPRSIAWRREEIEGWLDSRPVAEPDASASGGNLRGQRNG